MGFIPTYDEINIFGNGDGRDPLRSIGHLLTFFLLAGMLDICNDESLDKDNIVLLNIPIIVYVLCVFLQLALSMESNIKSKGLFQTIISIRGAIAIIQMIFYIASVAKYGKNEEVDVSIYVIRLCSSIIMNLSSEIIYIDKTGFSCKIAGLGVFILILAFITFIMEAKDYLGYAVSAVACTFTIGSFITRFSSKKEEEWCRIGYKKLGIGILLMSISFSLLYFPDFFSFQHWNKICIDLDRYTEKIQMMKKYFNETLGTLFSLSSDLLYASS